jgi:beta-glucosidase
MSQFPPGFTWGTATASYQIEGAATEDGRGPSIWDTFSATPGCVANGDTGLVACDHYHRYEEDIAIMKKLGVTAYRFSIAWPRLFPQGDGVREERGFAFYNKLIDALLDAGIEPVATVYHWDLPQPLQDRGGWANREIVDIFADYALACVEAFGDRVKTWITINEPWCVTWLGYQIGLHAPGVKDLSHAVAAAHHTALAHAAATRVMKGFDSELIVGLTVNMSNFRVDGSAPETLEAFDLMDGQMNRWWIDALMHGTYPESLARAYGEIYDNVVLPGDGDLLKTENPDFLGINYYSDSFIADARQDEKPLKDGVLFPFDVRANTEIPKQYKANMTDMDWVITPEGIRDVVTRVHNDWPSIPAIVITENGSAYADGPDENGVVQDDRRIAYLRAHVSALAEAVANGVPVTGYFAWSLLDNFEWSFGYAKRFGIVHVDFETQKRTIKNSALEYKAIVANRGVI